MEIHIDGPRHEDEEGTSGQQLPETSSFTITTTTTTTATTTATASNAATTIWPRRFPLKPTHVAALINPNFTITTRIHGWT